MSYLVLSCLAFIFSCSHALFPFPRTRESEAYAASLGGAPVGVYEHNSNDGYSEVIGASLSGAPVGIYGKESKKRNFDPLFVEKSYAFRHHQPGFPHAGVATASAFADSYLHKTGAASSGYEGNFSPIRRYYIPFAHRPAVIPNHFFF